MHHPPGPGFMSGLDYGHSVIAGLVLCSLVVAAGTLIWTRWLGVVLLAGLSVLWVLVNKPMEGVTLLTLTSSDGVTVADLTGVTGMGVAALRAWSLLRSRSKPAPDAASSGEVTERMPAMDGRAG